MSATQKSPRGGMVVYPRHYEISSQDDTEHFVSGVNSAGEPVRVQLKVPETFLRAAAVDENATVPRLVQFAETSRRARNPCLASPDNGPEDPDGVLLMEQVEPIDGKPGEYIAKWASVLSDSRDGLPAPIGLGYIEIGHPPVKGEEAGDRVAELEDLLAEIEGGATDKILDAEDLACNIRKNLRHWFIAVLVQYDRSNEINQAIGAAELKQRLADMLNSNTRDGCYGGVMLRLRDANGRVSAEYSRTINMTFDYAAKRPKTTDEVLDPFMKFHGGRLLAMLAKHPTLTLELIPTLRINYGKKSIGRYLKDMEQPAPKLVKTYLDKQFYNRPHADFDKEKAYLACHVAVRLAAAVNATDKGNRLVSAAHAFSAPIANIWTLNAQGEPAYTLVPAKAPARQNDAGIEMTGS